MAMGWSVDEGILSLTKVRRHRVPWSLTNTSGPRYEQSAVLNERYRRTAGDSLGRAARVPSDIMMLSNNPHRTLMWVQHWRRVYVAGLEINGRCECGREEREEGDEERCRELHDRKKWVVKCLFGCGCVGCVSK